MKKIEQTTKRVDELNCSRKQVSCPLPPAPKWPSSLSTKLEGSADAVIDRFASAGEKNCKSSTSMDCNSMRACMEAENKLREAVVGGGGGREQAVEGMGVEELEQYAAALEELLRNVELRSSTISQGFLS